MPAGAERRSGLTRFGGPGRLGGAAARHGRGLRLAPRDRHPPHDLPPPVTPDPGGGGIPTLPSRCTPRAGPAAGAWLLGMPPPHDRPRRLRLVCEDSPIALQLGRCSAPAPTSSPSGVSQRLRLRDDHPPFPFAEARRRRRAAGRGRFAAIDPVPVARRASLQVHRALCPAASGAEDRALDREDGPGRPHILKNPPVAGAGSRAAPGARSDRPGVRADHYGSWILNERRDDNAAEA